MVQRWGVPLLERQLWLFVVDDADTAAARSLREAVANALRLPEGGPYPSMADGCPGSDTDPSRYDPIDVRVVVAHPADDEHDRLVSPNEIPGLALLGERDDFEAHARWRAAVSSELLRAPATASGAYAPLATIADTLSLIAGQRMPRSLHEAEQLQSLGTGGASFVEVFFFSTRDDASPRDVSSYDTSGLCDWSNLTGLCPNVRTLLLGQDGVYIRNQKEAEQQQQVRNASYLSQTAANFLLDAAGSPDEFFYPILFAKRVYPCWDAAPSRRDDGTVDCRVHLLSSDLSPCEPALGRLDPLSVNGVDRVPMTESDATRGELRVCEIRQLEGTPLEHCLLHPEEPQYTAGFCHPEPTEFCRGLCGQAGRYPFSFRFVAGSTRVTSSALLRYSCRREQSD